MKRNISSLAMTIAAALILPTLAQAQPAAGETPWSVDVGIGWDNSISGNLFSSGIGTLSGRSAVIEERSWDEVYGTGVLFRIGVGYELGDRAEARGQFTYQSTGSDALDIGNVAGSDLFATFDDYKTWGLEGGYRAYFSEAEERWRPYAEGAIGFAIIDEIAGDFAAPAIGLTLTSSEFYDSTGAFTFGVAGGVLYRFTDRFQLDGRLGLRYVGGLSEVDSLLGTGFDDINDDSSRWTLPLTVGVRVRF